MNICDVNIAWYAGNILSFNFVISVSTDGSTFTNVFTGKSTGTTHSLEKYTLPGGTTGRFVRITVNGNNSNNFAGITELSIDGSSNVAAPQPTANNQNIQTTCCTPVQITLTGTDPITGDVPTFTVVTQPQHGTLTAGTVSSIVYYTPNTGFSGTDSFTYKATDGQGVSSNIATVTITVNAPPSVSQPTTGLLIPFYLYPQVWISGNAYEQLASIATAHPSVGITAVINPDSGPGTSQDPNFVQGISILKNAGIHVIGYIYTSYASRPIADVEADIDRYVSFYGSSISGIMFDEMSNTAGNENYYSTLSNYAKSKGLTFTAGNPGTDTLPSYIGTVDTLNIYEGSGVPSLGYLSGGWHSNYSKQNFSLVVYGVPSLNQTYITSAAKYVGYMYITDANLPNPYDTLPPYLEQLVTILGGNTTTAAPQDHSTFGFYFGSPITNATHVTALNKSTKQHNNTASYTPKTTTKK
jgi:hypothetical protein